MLPMPAAQIVDHAAVVDAVRKAAPWRPEALLPAFFDVVDTENVADCLRMASNGRKVDWMRSFEKAIGEVTGAENAIAVSNGTAALHLALLAVGVKPGDEVIVPTMTFAACAAAVTYCGATPHFVDCMYEPFGALNGYKLHQHLAHLSAEDRGRIRAAVVVDLLGHPGITGRLQWTCLQFNLPLVEDAAAALGTPDVGSGTVATISCNENKIVTTRGGGLVLVDDDETADHIRHLATTAKIASPWYYDHDEVGFNYRMPDINAAAGLGQVDRLGVTLRLKRELSERYRTALFGTGYSLVVDKEQSNRWLNVMLLDPRVTYEAELHRHRTLIALQEAGIAARAMFTPLHMLPPYKHCPRQKDLRVAEDIYRRAVCLPSGVGGG